jgi:hypothetical protein
VAIPEALLAALLGCCSASPTTVATPFTCCAALYEPLQGDAPGPAAAAAGGRRSSSTPAGIKTAQRWSQEEHDLLLQVHVMISSSAMHHQSCISSNASGNHC